MKKQPKKKKQKKKKKIVHIQNIDGVKRRQRAEKVKSYIGDEYSAFFGQQTRFLQQ